MRHSYKNILMGVTPIFVGSILCICIFIPLFLTLSSWAQLMIPTESLSYSYLRILISCLLNVLGFSISGFLMAIVISFISRNNCIIAITIANLLVTVAIIILLSRAIVFGTPWSFKNLFQVTLALEWFLDILLLWLCAFLGAWLMVQKRRKKILPSHSHAS